MWNGTFDDWELAFEIIKIEDKVWKGEDAAAKVADEIERIRVKLFFQNSPQIEEVYQDNNGLYDVRKAIQNPDDLIASVLARVDFAFSTSIESNHCDLNTMSVASKMLRHALETCTDDPHGLEHYLRSASYLIKQGIEDGKFAIGDELGHLIQTLDEMALQLRADHPEVGGAVKSRMTQRLKEIGDEKRLQAAEQLDAMQEGTGPRLSAEYALGAAITRDGSSIQATTEALQQGGNRAHKISLAEKAKNVESSGAMSSLKIGLRAQKVAEFLAELFSGGGMAG